MSKCVRHASPESARGDGAQPRVCLLPLMALIYYEVSGGPFGLEDAVGAAGSMLTILGLLVFPLVWCAPQALVASELIGMFPEDSGFVAWITHSFGRFLGFQEVLLGPLWHRSNPMPTPIRVLTA